MKLRELLSGVSVLACTADMEMEISGVSYDSRSVRPGDLFVAMTGFAVDGHKFIAAAQEKGAGGDAAVCADRGFSPRTGNRRGQLVRPSR